MTKDNKTTTELCFFREGINRKCSNSPSWKISGKTETLRFKVCDEHLAWAIRLSGYPALVDVHKSFVGRTKDEQEETLFEGLEDLEDTTPGKERSFCSVKDSTQFSED